MGYGRRHVRIFSSRTNYILSVLFNASVLALPQIREGFKRMFKMSGTLVACRHYAFKQMYNVIFVTEYSTLNCVLCIISYIYTSVYPEKVYKKQCFSQHVIHE